MRDLIEIDGSFGEGGGQILRTSLSLSLVTGKPFTIRNIRAGRRKPGLIQQHLTAVNAAAEICSAEVNGNYIASSEIYFAPKKVSPGRYNFNVGTAGSCTLVFQTVLPALLSAAGKSELILQGGTHNPFAPPFDFLEKTFLPVLNSMGSDVTTALERHGFYPKGGGKISIRIKPSGKLSNLTLLQRGKIRHKRAWALVAGLPRGIAERELKIVRERLALAPDCLHVEELPASRGPGNAVLVEIESEHVTESFTGFGKRGVRAEKVAEETVDEVLEYLASEVPVGKHLADQLLIPIAMAGSGTFKTLSPTSHTVTNIEILKRFLDVDINVSGADEGTTIITIKTA